MVARSVVGLTGHAIREKAGIGAKKVDVVFGGAPCQGFSLIGHRALDDPRNWLVREFVRIVAELDSSYFVFENVKGLTIGKHRNFLEELIDAFDAAGYEVRLPWRVLDAAFFEVPQHRERLILMGAKKGVRVPQYPDPLCQPADSMGFDYLPLGPSCRDALSDLPNCDDFAELWNVDEVRAVEWGKPSSYARQLRCIASGCGHFGYRRKWNRQVLTSSLRTEHTEISRRRFGSTEPGQVEPISRFYRLLPAGLSNTLRAGTDSSRGAFTSPRPIHYAYPRCVTVREMARLHGFPDWFRFHVTKWHGARQIGNSVPPPLARAVASEIIRAMRRRPSPPVTSLELGNSALLKMEMSEAAEYYGTAVPIGKRDRKSGARKRKQQEIEAEMALLLPLAEFSTASVVN